MDLEYIKQHGYEPRRIKSDLTKEEIAYFMENRAKFPGIQIVEENVRHYDPDTVAVQTIGYLRKFKGSKSVKVYEEIDQSNKDQDNPGMIYTEEESVGYDGLERMYQEELRGKSGYLSIPINPQNMVDGVPTMVAPEKAIIFTPRFIKTFSLPRSRPSWISSNISILIRYRASCIRMP